MSYEAGMVQGAVVSNNNVTIATWNWNEAVQITFTFRVLLVATNLAVSTGILLSFTMIMLVIYRQRRLKKPSNNFILSMCVTDFMVTLIIAPHFIASAVLGRWPSTYLHCKILAFLNTCFMGMSILNLILIAIDRMVAIFKPTKYRLWLCDKNCRILCFCFWSYSAVIASFTYYDTFSRPMFDGGIMTCLLAGQSFLTLQLFCEVLPGLVVTATCYTIIVVKLVKRSANIYSTGHKVSKVNYEIRMAKIGGLVSGFFIATYLPYYTIMFAYRQRAEALLKVSAGVIVVTSYNFDAFMYGYCNRNYRKEIKKFLHRKMPWLAKISPVEHSTTTDTANTMFTNAPRDSTAAGGIIPRLNTTKLDPVASGIKEDEEISSDST